MRRSIDVTGVRGSGRSTGAGEVRWSEVGRQARLGSEKKSKASAGAAWSLHVRFLLWRLAAQSGTWSTWNALWPFSALGSCS